MTIYRLCKYSGFCSMKQLGPVVEDGLISHALFHCTHSSNKHLKNLADHVIATKYNKSNTWGFLQYMLIHSLIILKVK